MITALFFAGSLTFFGVPAICIYHKVNKETSIMHKKHEEEFFQSLETGLIIP